ncbi:MAG TPA: hypothetical protein VJZ00_11205 [Thermoanaerobaculia bacterium]|nr:hypothetical protein [Thermoanaerobaculia bacterium]
MRFIGAIAVAFVVASCAAGFIGEPTTGQHLDDHCILHAVAELDNRSDRLISQARNAGDMDVRRVADTLATDRSRRRTMLEQWREHAEPDHEIARASGCSSMGVPINTRGGQRDAAIVAALIETHECALDLLRDDRCEKRESVEHRLVADITRQYQRELVALRSIPLR